MSDTELCNIKEGNLFGTSTSRGFSNPIQISWQEPEKKIEISESEFDEAFLHAQYEALAMNSWQKTREILKQKLFGAENEL